MGIVGTRKYEMMLHLVFAQALRESQLNNSCVAMMLACKADLQKNRRISPAVF